MEAISISKHYVEVKDKSQVVYFQFDNFKDAEFYVQDMSKITHMVRHINVSEIMKNNDNYTIIK